VIRCRHLTQRYGERLALDDLNLEVPAGEAFAFIGPNGAGKTTTIRILATLLEPTEGDALVAGFSALDEADEVRRVLGYMPDSFGVYDGMRVWEYLEFFAAAYRIPRANRQRTVSDVLELTDLGTRRETNIEHLSKGMKQRLCLARTLLHDPQVLVLDEPASGLDPRARIDLKELLRELTRMGKTLFVSSHILPELADFCTTVGILEQGRLLACGRVDEILATMERGRAMRLKVLRDLEQAGALVEGTPGSTRVRVQDGVLHFHFEGSLEELAALAERVADLRLGLVEFAEARTDLEDVFMRVTRGVVS
jgi:ABC-2 type transport system ATP-binding protein